MQRIALAPDHEISRVIRGGWQMAGGHGAIDSAEAVADMIAFADAGITAFDCADIYTGVEELIGAFRRAYADLRGAEALARIRVHTKYVPDLDLLPRLTKADVEAVIDRSLRRLGAERLDLVQFHWWDYAVPGWLEAAHWLDELRQAGKIRHVGGTNFDTGHMAAIVDSGRAAALDAAAVLAARPPPGEGDARRPPPSRGVALLCYGTVAGGFLGDRWLGQPEPARAAREPLADQVQARSSTISAAGTCSSRCSPRSAASPTGTAATSPPSRARPCSPARGSPR